MRAVQPSTSQRIKRAFAAAGSYLNVHAATSPLRLIV